MEGPLRDPSETPRVICLKGNNNMFQSGLKGPPLCREAPYFQKTNVETLRGCPKGRTWRLNSKTKLNQCWKLHQFRIIFFYIFFLHHCRRCRPPRHRSDRRPPPGLEYPTGGTASPTSRDGGHGRCHAFRSAAGQVCISSSRRSFLHLTTRL